MDPSLQSFHVQAIHCQFWKECEESMFSMFEVTNECLREDAQDTKCCRHLNLSNIIPSIKASICGCSTTVCILVYRTVWHITIMFFFGSLKLLKNKFNSISVTPTMHQMEHKKSQGALKAPPCACRSFPNLEAFWSIICTAKEVRVGLTLLMQSDY